MERLIPETQKTMTEPVTYKRLRVPWVTRWSDEVDVSKIDLVVHGGQPGLSYPDGMEFRDDHGVLWQREGLGRGGEPQFAHVSAHRQRACMLRRRCQVCGDKITDRPIRWLMNAGQLSTRDDGATITMSPPTCSDCVPVALESCPHLRTQDPIVVKVLEFRVWGVFGDVVRPDVERGPGHVQRARGVYVPYTAPFLTLTLAKQQVVEFTKFAIEGAARASTDVYQGAGLRAL